MLSEQFNFWKRLIKVGIEVQRNEKNLREAFLGSWERIKFFREKAFFTLKPKLIPTQPMLCNNSWTHHCKECRDPHCVIAGGLTFEEMVGLDEIRRTMWRPIQHRFFQMGQLRIQRLLRDCEVFVAADEKWLSDSLIEWLGKLRYTDRNWDRDYRLRGDEVKR